MGALKPTGLCFDVPLLYISLNLRKLTIPGPNGTNYEHRVRIKAFSFTACNLKKEGLLWIIKVPILTDFWKIQLSLALN